MAQDIQILFYFIHNFLDLHKFDMCIWIVHKKEDKSLSI